MRVLRELEERRESLQERSAARRAVIAQSSAALAARLGLLDRAVAVTRGLVGRPLLVGTTVALALLLGRRRVFGWIGRAVTIIGLVRGVAAALRDPQSR